MFELHRTEDPSGITSTGIIAQGVEFDDGWVALSFLNSVSVGVYESMDEIDRIHGHDGKTIVVWDRRTV